MELLFTNFTSYEIYSVLLIFCRVSSFLLMIPGIGLSYVSPRIRLFIGLLVSILLQPILLKYLPSMPKVSFLLAFYIFKEIVIGIFLGSLAKILVSAVQMAGTIISMQSSLSSATLFNPASHSSESIISMFFSIIVMTLFMVGDLHHLFFQAFIETYKTIPTGYNFLLGDISKSLFNTLTYASLLAIKISFPFIVVTIIIMVAGGVLSRLMPSMQVFFIINSGQIFIAFIILLITISTALLWYIEKIVEFMNSFPTIN